MAETGTAPVQRDVLAPEETLTIDGVVYPVGLFDDKLVDKFEAWCAMEAWKEIEGLRGSLPPDVHKEMMQNITLAIGSKEYRLGGKGFGAMEASMEGQYKKVHLMLQARTPTLTWDTIQKWRKSEYNAGMLKRIADAQAALRETAPPA